MSGRIHEATGIQIYVWQVLDSQMIKQRIFVRRKNLQEMLKRVHFNSVHPKKGTQIHAHNSTALLCIFIKMKPKSFMKGDWNIVMCFCLIHVHKSAIITRYCWRPVLSRSPKLSSLDCILWGHQKSLVYATAVDSNEYLVAIVNEYLVAILREYLVAILLEYLVKYPYLLCIV